MRVTRLQQPGRGSRSSNWNGIMQKFGNRMNWIISFQASLLFGRDTTGGILGRLRASHGEHSSRLSWSLPQSLLLENEDLGENMDKENRNRASVRVCKMRNGRDRIHLCSVCPNHSPHLPLRLRRHLLTSSVLVSLLCSVPLFSGPGCCKVYGSNLHARPEGTWDNVCALRLSSGFQVKAITLPN